MCPVQIVTYVSGSDTAADGAPGRIRTCDPEIRNLVLYPAELRARWASYSKIRVAETGESGVAGRTPYWWPCRISE